MDTISFSPVRGMRDFYPEEMRLRDRIFNAWSVAANASGFEHYDACVVESLPLLTRKAGEEIVDQIYAFDDKSGRKLALRPEMTPSLARMVVSRQGALSFPIKWFTIAQCFRYERTTRGRKREHYQWNLDIVGTDTVAAEAEILATAVSAMRGMGLPDSAYRIHVSSRALLSELLQGLGIDENHHPAVFLALDKRGKLPDTEIKALLAGEGLNEDAITTTFELLDIKDIADAQRIVGEESPALAQLTDLFALTDAYGITDILRFDVSVVRGLSYYTGIVFEAFDVNRSLRAIFGGGRYDNLLTQIGGNPASAVGLGFGDVVIAELIKELKLTAEGTRADGVIVGYMAPEQRIAATRIAATLRAQGRNVTLQLTAQKAKRFFSDANRAAVSHAVFIGPDDIESGEAKLKDLETREQSTITF